MNQSDWVLSIVTAFYDKAKTDILIGYHFRNIKDFDEHIPRIASFWEMQLFGTTDRKIDPPFDVIRAHMPLGIKRGELGRWLLLFKNTLDEHADHFALKEKWLEKLFFFEGVFLRFLGF